MATGWSRGKLFLLGFLDLFLPKICNHGLFTVLLFILDTIFPDYTVKINCNSLIILFPHPWSDAAYLCRALFRLGILTLWAGSQTLLSTAPGHPPRRGPRPGWWQNWTRCPLSHGSRWSSHRTGSCAVGRRSTWKLRLCWVCMVFTHCQISA